MSDVPKKRNRRAPYVLGALAIVLCAWLWWRMGGVEVAVDKVALDSLRVTTDPAEFTVFTYNVQARPWFDDSAHKFKYISPLLNPYDICVFQECFKDHARLWADASHPVKIYFSRLKNPFKIVGAGLSMLSKFPLVDTKAMNYSDPGDFQNWPASKGALMGRFDVHGMTLDVYTSHFAAGKKEGTKRGKPIQAAELTAFINANSPPENNVILLGDFNMRPSRGAADKEKHKDDPKVYIFDTLRDALKMRDADDEINGPKDEVIDRVLFRPGAGCTMKPLSWQRDTPEFYDPAKEPLSDHKPVFVKFRLSKP